MKELVMAVLWFMLPAGFANMTPVLFKFIPLLNYPVDFGLEINGKRMFGKNKTWRGIISGTIASIVVVWMQHFFSLKTVMVDYANINVVLLGFLLGFGALAGDLIESFFKRQAGIEPGKSWVPFDQVDWIFGALLFSNFYIEISMLQKIAALSIFGLLHPILNLGGYYVGIKK